MPGPVAALADHERSWLLGCDQIIVASGRRDMGLAFPGWELPGVMGAAAAWRLAAGYGALETRCAIVLGSSVDALQTIEAMRRAGVEIRAVIERAETPVAPAAQIAGLAGIPVLTSHVVQRAAGDAGGVRSVVVVEVDAEGRHLPGTERHFDCDTVVLGIGAVPAIELLEAMGCAVAFRPERGGHVPVLDAGMRTSLPFVHAIGDCAGIWPAKTRDADNLRREALVAVASVAAALGAPDSGEPAPAPPIPDLPTPDLGAYRCAWVRASVIEAAGEPYVCQCEEVTAREILTVRPPRYLDWKTPTQKPADLASLLGEGVPNPDHIKRLTRAGMGPCQGRRCREQVAALLALGAGTPLGDVPLATFRAPVRPVPLSLLADAAEPAEMSAHWDSWFGMASQWTPFWRVGPSYKAAERDADGPVASE
jgi:thioredoxin reductase